LGGIGIDLPESLAIRDPIIVNLAINDCSDCSLN